jgi:hypothetical protein
MRAHPQEGDVGRQKRTVFTAAAILLVAVLGVSPS